MPHILHVVADGAPGGGTTAVLGLCSDLRNLGFRTSLITQRDSYGFQTGQALKLETRGLDFFRSRFDRSIPKRLHGLISELSPDLVHVHGARAGHAFCSQTLRRIPSKLVYTVHGYHFLKRPLAWRALGWVAEKRIAQRADQVVFVSRNDRNIAERFRILGSGPQSDRKSSTIYNGIDPRDLDATPAAPPTYDLVFAGRMHAQKNPSFLVDIMAELSADQVTLLMIGGGELEAEVRAYAERRGVASRITFKGALTRAQALSALASGRVYVFPSRWEGLPIGPIEAMYYGLPVVASAIGGTDEVVQHQVNGFLLNAFEPRSYASAIRRLLNEPDLYARYAAAGRKRVESLFLRQSSSASYRSVYDRLL
ncbi:MAG TPA: glycosyltransferase family 4 protein [Polyangiaceae bacterium]|nr:glycosyltransferase family 4 protein [Polyangiaceae bacterium]